MIYAVEMASYGMIYLPFFKKINTGFQTILRFCFSNLKNCDDITKGRDL
jgi:hypothetical protein